MTVPTRNWSYPSLLGRRNSKDEEKLLKQVSLILESFLSAVVSSVTFIWWKVWNRDYVGFTMITRSTGCWPWFIKKNKKRGKSFYCWLTGALYSYINLCNRLFSFVVAFRGKQSARTELPEQSLLRQTERLRKNKLKPILRGGTHK